MEMQVNPDPELLKILVWILVAILGILVVVLGYFVKELASNVKVLRDALPKMQATIDIKIPDLEKEVEKHQDCIDDHESRLTTLELKHSMNQKKPIRRKNAVN